MDIQLTFVELMNEWMNGLMNNKSNIYLWNTFF